MEILLQNVHNKFSSTWFHEIGTNRNYHVKLNKRLFNISSSNFMEFSVFTFCYITAKIIGTTIYIRDMYKIFLIFKPYLQGNKFTTNPVIGIILLV